MQLTSENYYSQEANQEYMSVSGYKDFAGTYGKMPCEFYGMEKLNGRWQDEKSTALLVGSYVDSYFEGSLDQFKNCSLVPSAKKRTLYFFSCLGSSFGANGSTTCAAGVVCVSSATAWANADLSMDSITLPISD